MNRFGALVQRLARHAADADRCVLLADYLDQTPDPDRGWALALLTGRHRLPTLHGSKLRKIAGDRNDPILFQLSHDYVRDLSETTALLWPDPAPGTSGLPLSAFVSELETGASSQLLDRCTGWLDRLEAEGRWVVLKLLTGGRPAQVSWRLAVGALARLADKPETAIEPVWHGLDPPFVDLFPWLVGSAAQPAFTNPAPYWPQQPIAAQTNPSKWNCDSHAAIWDFGGARAQISTGRRGDGTWGRHIFLADGGEDVSANLPDLTAHLDVAAAVDGELVVVRDNRVLRGAELRKRLFAKVASQKAQREAPVHFLARDLLRLGDRDLRDQAFDARYGALRNFLAGVASPRVHLSPRIEFASGEDLAARREVAAPIAGIVTGSTHGCLLTPRDGSECGGWQHWRPDRKSAIAVLMYAHAIQSTRPPRFDSYTFGVWSPTASGRELVPIGKCPPPEDENQLDRIDRYIRDHPGNRFGPVREVVANVNAACVCELQFDGIQSAGRRKAGLELQGPQISRLFPDLPPIDATTLADMKKMLPG